MEIKLTGIASEILNASELDIPGVSNVAEIREHLLLKQPDLNKYRLQFAVNSVVATDKKSVKSNDSVLVFGPYSGG